MPCRRFFSSTESMRIRAVVGVVLMPMRKPMIVVSLRAMRKPSGNDS